MTGKNKGILCIIASAFGFAVMALCVGWCDHWGDPISPFQKAFFRNLPAVFIAWWVWRRTCNPMKGLHQAGPMALLITRSAVGAAGIFCNFYALSHIPISEGMTLNKTAPFFTVFMSWLFLKEKLSLRQFLALSVAFIGALFIIKPGFQPGENLAFALALAGGFCAGTAYVCVHRLGQFKVPSAFIVLFFSAFSCLASVPFVLARGYEPMTWAQWLILVGAGLGGAIGQFGVTSAYRYAEPRQIAVYDYTNLLFTAVLGFVFLGQLPDAWSFLGFALIILAALRVR